MKCRLLSFSLVTALLATSVSSFAMDRRDALLSICALAFSPVGISASESWQQIEVKDADNKTKGLHSLGLSVLELATRLSSTVARERITQSVRDFRDHAWREIQQHPSRDSGEPYSVLIDRRIALENHSFLHVKAFLNITSGDSMISQAEGEERLILGIELRPLAKDRSTYPQPTMFAYRIER